MNPPGDQGLPVVQSAALTRPAGVQHKSTAEVACPRSMVGRVIGKNGETIKALQTYTGALIQIDQSTDPTRVTISGTSQSLSLAISMVTDICKGTFKGFALLRQLIQPQRQPPGPSAFGSVVQPRPVYAPGYGLIPPSQLYGADDPNMAAPGLPQVLGSRPVTVQLPPGFQYVQAPGGEAGPVMVGMPGTVPGHTLTQQMDGTALLGQPMPVRQVPVQQVYNSAPMAGSTYTTQLAYYPQDFSGGAGEQLMYPQHDGTLISLQPGMQLHSLPGSTTSKVIGAGAPGQGMRMGARQGGVQQPQGARWGGNNWVEGGKLDSSTMGQVAVNELLGNTAGPGQGQTLSPSMSGLGGSNTAGAGNSGNAQQQLVQVINREGKLYYLQGADQ